MDYASIVETTTFVSERQLDQHKRAIPVIRPNGRRWTDSFRSLPAVNDGSTREELVTGVATKTPPIFLGIHKQRVKAARFLTKWPILSYLEQLLPEPTMYRGSPVVDALYHTVTHAEGAVFPNVKCGDVLMITRDTLGRLDIALTLRQEDHDGIEL